MVESCSICGGLWSEDRIVHIKSDGKQERVCQDCLREWLHR